MATLTEGRYACEFIISEQCGTASRDAIIVKSGQNLKAGAVLGAVTTAAATSAAGTNTGNGTMGAITVSAGAIEGKYTLKITKAAANAGDFEVIDPQGDVSGIGTVAVAYSTGGLAFTLADGATDFAVGDTFVITVVQSAIKYAEHDPAATDGTAKAVAVLFADVDASSADKPGVAIARQAEVNGSEITWITGISAANKALGIKSLAEKFVIVR
ncbi:MAG: head decoration protein [Saprospiraceae bacterium]|nr:head decoration protein [Saprospiraceae bacterium]